VDDKEIDEEDIAAAAPVDAMDRLELDMKKAILDERYEDAAKLRDEIQEIRQKREQD
jgi:protein-arginine kinase activator protein McsA